MSGQRPAGIRSVCTDCLASERLAGLRTGAAALIAIRRPGELERCVMCGFPFADQALNDERPRPEPGA